MKFFFVLYLLFFSSNAMAWTGYWERATRGPLRQIVLSGYYVPEDEKEFEKSEEHYRTWGYLEEGESFKESSLYGGEGKERYGGKRKYCHKETDPDDEGYTVIFNPNLRARLYDKEWNLLTEDYLRSSQPEMYTPFTWRVRSYVPYHPEAYYLRVVRLVENKEVAVLRETRVNTLKWLKSGGSSYRYDKFLKCYRVYHI